MRRLCFLPSSIRVEVGSISMLASEQLMYSTVRIETILANNAGRSTGTGFFFDFLRDETQGRTIPTIVTNKHVVANGTVGILHLHEHDDALVFPH